MLLNRYTISSRRVFSCSLCRYQLVYGRRSLLSPYLWDRCRHLSSLRIQVRFGLSSRSIPDPGTNSRQITISKRRTLCSDSYQPKSQLVQPSNLAQASAPVTRFPYLGGILNRIALLRYGDLFYVNHNRVWLQQISGTAVLSGVPRGHSGPPAIHCGTGLSRTAKNGNYIWRRLQRVSLIDLAVDKNRVTKASDYSH